MRTSMINIAIVDKIVVQDSKTITPKTVEAYMHLIDYLKVRTIIQLRIYQMLDFYENVNKYKDVYKKDT